jgi:transcriptional regulator with XRE-family HTH domain
MKDIREAKNWTLVELSIATGVSVSTLSAIEKYGYYPQTESVRTRIATSLGVAESDVWNNLEGVAA